MNARSQFSDVVCPGCTLLCDDLEVTTQGRQVIPNHACELGRAFFSHDTPGDPVHMVSGVPAELDVAVGAAARILGDSKAPLIFGLDQLTTQAQQTAWKIADRLGGVIDTSAAHSSRASMFALQRVGKVTASLGEIANRSDLIVFWFCDPETTHPRLLERLHHPANSPNRRVIVIGDQSTPTSQRADQFIEIKRDSAAALLDVLRAIGAGVSLDPDSVLQSTGIGIVEIEALASQLATAKYGAVFHGQIGANSEFDLASDRLNSLVGELNNVTRFVEMKLRLDSNAQSAENVVAWSCGYPFATSHHRKYPRFHWLEYSAESVLARHECDAVLLAAGPQFERTLAGLPASSLEFMASIPSIVIGPGSGNEGANIQGAVVIQTRLDGRENIGEFCRNDDVSLPLTAVIPPGLKSVSAAEVWERILAAISDPPLSS